MNAIAAMLLVCTAISSSPTDIAQELSRGNFRRVGVVPRVMQKVDGREIVAEKLGPNAELLAQKFSKALADVASTRYQGRMSVVSHRVMRSAFDKLSPDALGDLDALRKVGQQTGVNALVIVYVADNGSTLEETYGIVPISGDETGEIAAKHTAIKTIADYAYMGGSFEAKRWKGNELVPVGLKMPVASQNVPFSALDLNQDHPLQRPNFPYGIELVMRPGAAGQGGAAAGPVSFLKNVVPVLQANCFACHNPGKASGGYDMTSFQRLLAGGESGSRAITPGDPNQSYLLAKITPRNGQAEMPKGRRPLADNQIAMIAKWIEAGAVDDSGQAAGAQGAGPQGPGPRPNSDVSRPPVVIGKDLYVPMNEDEVYGVRVWNFSERPVYMALYIDGVNSIGKQLENSTETPTNRMWFIKPGPEPSVIPGYLTIDEIRGPQQSSELFTTAESSQSLAAEIGFTDRLGMVTAVFFDFIPKDGVKAIPRIGTKAGERQQVEIREWGVGIKGDLLTAMTVRYATQEDIDDYKQNGSPQDRDPIVNNVRPQGQNIAQDPNNPISGQTVSQTTPSNRRPVPAPDDNGSVVSVPTSTDPDESVPFPRSGVASSSSDPKKY